MLEEEEEEEEDGGGRSFVVGFMHKARLSQLLPPTVYIWSGNICKTNSKNFSFNRPMNKTGSESGSRGWLQRTGSLK